MISNNVVEICMPHKIWSLPEAQELVPYLQAVTERHEKAVDVLIKTQQKLIKNGAPTERIDELQKEVNSHMVRWGVKIRKLGASPLTGGAVGIDAGGFYWSWCYSEKKIEHYHMLYEDPKHRRHLSLKV